jgi:hypothetical protein
MQTSRAPIACFMTRVKLYQREFRGTLNLTSLLRDGAVADLRLGAPGAGLDL